MIILLLIRLPKRGVIILHDLYKVNFSGFSVWRIKKKVIEVMVIGFAGRKYLGFFFFKQGIVTV